MSLILKGIDLPKASNDDILIILQSNGEARCNQQGKSEKTIEAIQIPTPHGRLIDENDVKAKCVNEVFDKMGTVAITETYFGDEWADDICDVPTILEAEE